jgi:hypothetical protein
MTRPSVSVFCQQRTTAAQRATRDDKQQDLFLVLDLRLMQRIEKHELQKVSLNIISNSGDPVNPESALLASYNNLSSTGTGVRESVCSTMNSVNHWSVVGSGNGDLPSRSHESSLVSLVFRLSARSSCSS